MTEDPVDVNELKAVLEQAANPTALDDHPWTRALMVDEQPPDNNAGARLLLALGERFRETMPSAPPRRGKRLDSKWGQFGMLAAMYFAPLHYGTPRPSSLRDAAGRIDEAIALYVFGPGWASEDAAAFAAYQLLADESAGLPSSTLSDWHRQGLVRLANRVVAHEQHLSRETERGSVLLGTDDELDDTVLEDWPSDTELDQRTDVDERPRTTLAGLYAQYARALWLGLAIAAALIVGWKVIRVVSLSVTLNNSARALLAAAEGIDRSNLDLATLPDVGDDLHRARRSMVALERELRPLAWAGKAFGWLPGYGYEVAHSRELLALGSGLLVAADEAYLAGEPLLALVQDDTASIGPDEMLALVADGGTHFEAALAGADRAIAARETLDPALMRDEFQPYMARLDDALPIARAGLALASAAPRLLGADDYGAQTYLVLLQNEDELRATGGFITGVAGVTIEDAGIINVQVEDSYAVDDASKPYPVPPAPLQEFMAARVQPLRDANWSPHFPYVAQVAETLYGYSRAPAVDGVVAIDQEAVRQMLGVIGEVTVPETGEVISADNFFEFVRSAKDPVDTEFETDYNDWYANRKDFMRVVADAIIARISEGEADWVALGWAVFTLLEERHVLIVLDDPVAGDALAALTWDGALSSAGGDVLMVVDSNVGFNKVNAVVDTRIAYDVSLIDLGRPTAAVTVTHTHTLPVDVDCVHGPDYGDGTYQDTIERCYWDYMRVLTHRDAQLLDATPMTIPGDNLIFGESFEARVDVLDRVRDVQEWGTMLLVHPGETAITNMRFALPAYAIIAQNPDGSFSYRLTVRKQPGTLAVPLSLTVRLPQDASGIEVPPEGSLSGSVWTWETDLRTDRSVVLTFR